MNRSRTASLSKLFAGFAFLFFSNAIYAVTYIATGSAWNYLGDGSDQGTAWQAPGFDDSGWSSGAAQLGYGDGDEATVVGFGPDAANKFITTYFRHSFSVNNASQVTDLTLNLLRDDGAVVYLNGTEVVRSNMPGGTITSTTLAATAIGNPEESTTTAFSISPALLVTGTNVLAVEVHQGAVSSSDISFELGLTGTDSGPPDTQAPDVPTNLIAATVSPIQINISWTSSTDSGGGIVAGYNIYRDGGSTPIATVTGTSYTDTGLNENTAYSYQVSAFDNAVPANESLTAGAIESTMASPATIEVAVIGDYGFSGQPELSVANLVKSWNPDYIVTLGDNNYEDGEAATIDANVGQYYQEFLTNYSGIYGAGSVANRFFPALGNHDWRTTVAGLPKPYLDYFTLPGNERYYSFKWGPVEFFVVDSSVNEPDGNAFDSIQGQWLQNSLSASIADWKIVLLHLSPYSSEKSGGSDHGSQPIVQWPYELWGADAVLSGHDHTYERFQIGSIPYFVNGVGGRSVRTFGPILPQTQARYNSNYGAIKLIADTSSMTFEFYSIEGGGALIDTFTLSSSNTAPTITATENQSNAEGDLVSLIVSANDLEGDSLSYSAVGLPSSLSIDPVTGVIGGTIDILAGGMSPYNVTVSVTDGFYTVKSNFVWNVSTVDLLAPTVPTNLNAAAISNTRVDLDWNASVDNGGGVVAGYNIYRDGDNATPIATVTGTGYSDTGLTANTLYSYSVTAFDNATPANESAAATASATTLAIPVAATFIPTGSAWSYLDNGSNQGTAWQAIGFNDSGWASGAGQLGYGDGDEATVVSFGPNASNKFITTYFRHSFNVVNASQVTDLTLNLLRDDGAVVYLNGTEVVRPNMPGGTITSSTLAATAIGNPEESTTRAFSVSPALLVTGTNVLAVEVHQGAVSSSDISFELGLTGTENSTPDTGAPNVPTGLNGTAAGSSQIDLSWTASTDTGGGSVAGYNVYRDGGSTPIATVTGTGYSDTGLPSGTSFSYTVSAFDTAVPANESLQTAAVVVSTGSADTQAPDVPTNLNAAAISNTRVDLDWNASVDNGGGVVAGYNIYRDGDNATPIATVTGTGYSDTGLTANTLYSYSVTAFDNATPANESAAATASATTLAIPVAATFIPTGSAWSYLDNGSNQGTAWQAIGFNDSGWASGAGQLGYGDGDEATVVSFGPNASNKFITTYFRHSFNVVNASQVTDLTLNLLRDDGAVVYLNGTEVVRPNMPGGTITSSTLAATAIGNPEESTTTAFSVSPALLVTGTNVLAVEVHQGSNGSSDLSFELGLTGTENATPDTGAPSTPTGLAGVAAGASQIDLSWTASTDTGGGSVAGYKVYRDGGSTPVATVTGTSYSDTGLPSGTSFSYTVSAFDTAVPANESLQTAAVVVSTGSADTQAPDVPTNLNAAAISNTRVDLDWNASVDNGGGVVAGYNIYRDGDNATPIATVTGTSYSDTGLTANTLYNYSVTAFDNAVPANESASADVSALTFSTLVSLNIVQQGAVWNYLDDGSDQGAAWRATGFNDSGWASGAAELGYGDGDEATVVNFGPDASNKFITTYFRHSFTVTDAAQVASLTLNLLRDDGAVVYLNGTEVVRSNMPGGTITSTRLAATAIGNPEESTTTAFSISPALLVTGTNVLAVEVHQGDITSSDISFDLSLDGVVPPQFANGILPLTENFDTGFAYEWQVTDEAGNPSAWAIVDKKYHQQNQVRASNQNLIETYHVGSYSVLNDGFALIDYRVSLDVTPLGGAGDNIGIMFRYQDKNNYYRLSIDNRFGFTRLEKRVGGTFTTLARNAKGYVLNQAANISIEVVGQTILVTLDDVPLFSASDPDIGSGTVALYASTEATFDNIVIDQVAAVPDIIISTPTADSVEPAGAFTVLAIASHIPAGGRVDFLLDGGFIDSDGTPPYTANFSSIQGEHTVTVDLFGSDSVLIDSHTNTVVGVLGDNYLSIGDSITNGTGDNYAADNQSADGRLRSISGYQPLLNDLLTTSMLYPQIIFNEGVGGDESFDATTRISSILERHPNANRALIMLGTNDTQVTLPVIGSVFRSNMNTLLGALPSGMAATVAIPPPVFGQGTPYTDPINGSLNDFIRDYRTEITTNLTGITVGPDFFKCFLEDANYFSLFADVLHTNALGTDVMSRLWDEILTGAMLPTDPCTIPRFVLKSFEPSTVAPYLKQNLIETGDEVYVDETYTLSTLPSGLGLETGVWVMTRNADSINTSSAYITFDVDRDDVTVGVDRDVSVYVAYDIDTGNVAETLPDWMITDGYTDTTLEITLSGVARPLRLYSAVFSGVTGTPIPVTLGGNLATGAAGALNNYLVIVVEN